MPAETHRPGRQRLSSRAAPGLIAAISPARPGPAGRPGRYMRLVLAGAVTLHWRAGHAAGPAPSAAGWEVRLLARFLLLVLGAVIVLGTAATGAGPDAGSPDVPRFGFRFQAAAELHAVVVMFLAGLTVAMFFALRPGSVARPVLRAYVMLLLATVLQGAVGYVQYFGGLPAGLIEAHIAGAGILVIAAVRFNLALGPGTPGWAARKSPGTGKPGLPRWTRWRAAAQRSGGGSSGMTAPGLAVLEDGHACMMLLSPTEWSG